MHRAHLLIIVIGIFSGTLASAEVQLSEDGGSLNPKMVYVEPTGMSTSTIDGQQQMQSYRERRGRWGTTVSMGYSAYQPVNYKPHFATGDFSDFYKSADMPLLEAQFTVKRNLSMGSLGGEISIGAYKNGSDVDITIVDSTLTIYPVRLGANLYLDCLSDNPVIVPYGSAGIYTMIYRESQGSASRNGTTQIAPYFNLGIEFKLDGIDKRAALIAYRDSGIQSTYVFLEARKFMTSSAAKDPDFGTDVDFAGGVRVEF